ncbi:MAG: serine/threonine-protein kinase [Bdellovibrionota bacterium]
MSDSLKKFGKFFLLDRIAQGGMAEIYRARMATPDGGGRLIAIKRIIGNYSRNQEFVTMFRSEIKTTSGLTHPNIVQLYDFGEVDGMQYIAMEYVDGKNLRQFVSRFTETQSRFPIEASVYIIEQCALGLAYAHSYKDKFSGKPLSIVHRDVSPQNVLISYDGAVKVIDFGIAKAVTNVDATRAGVIKGKPSYLSPEQISGDTLDGRSDIFALGAVFWELLTGRKLFSGENDYAVIKLIETCSTHVKPPSIYNAQVPKELDAIVLKCLTKDRDQRYGSAEELQRALHKLLYQYAPEFNPADLAYYARDLFKNEIVEDRKMLLKLNEKAEQLLGEATTTGIGGPEIPIPTDVEDKTVTESKSNDTSSQKRRREESSSFRMVDFKDKVKAKPVTLDTPIELNQMTSKASAEGRYNPAPGSTRFLQTTRNTSSGLARPADGQGSRSPFAFLILLVAALAGGYWYYAENKTLSPAGAHGQKDTRPILALRGNIKAATISIDDKQVASEFPAEIRNLPTDKPFRLTVSANGYRKFTEEITISTGESKSLSINLERADAAGSAPSPSPDADLENTVVLRFNVTPIGLGTVIRVSGQTLDSSGITNAPVDKPLEVIVERDGFRTFAKTMTINSKKISDAKEYTIDVALEPAKFGYVTIKTTPSADALISIDGIEQRWATPISRKRVPVGTYRVRLVNAVLGMEKEVKFTVKEDRFTNIEERLLITDDNAREPSSR